MAQTQSELSGLANRAILVNLSIGQWDAKAKDKQISADVIAQYGASPEAGVFIKNLLPASHIEVAAEKEAKKEAAKTRKAAKQQARAEGKAFVKRFEGKLDEAAAMVTKASSYKALRAHLSNVRNWYYSQTLPWSDDGRRILPNANHTAFFEQYRAAKAVYERLLDEFEVDYPALKDKAGVLLNGMMKLADYPENIRKRYRLDVGTFPVPMEGDYRVQLTEAEIAILEAETQARVKDAFQSAQEHAVKMLFDVLSKTHERLTSTDDRYKDGMGKFHDSLIDNMREICDVLKRLNVGDDPRLEKFRRDTELIAMSEAETLRKNVDVRIETADRAAEVLDGMMAAFGPRACKGKGK